MIALLRRLFGRRSTPVAPVAPTSTPKVVTKSRLAGAAGAGLLATTIAFVGGWEGLETRSYRDIVGVWTACYGDPRQLSLDFDAPIAEVVELRPLGPTPGMPVHLHDHGGVIDVTCADEQIGIVEPRQYRTLSALLGRMEVQIEPVLGEEIEGVIQIVVHWRTDERAHRSLVRCVPAAGDTRLAA